MKYLFSLCVVGVASCVAMADPCHAVVSTRIVQVAQPQYVQTVQVAQPVYVQQVAVQRVAVQRVAVAQNHVVAVGNGNYYGGGVAVNQFSNQRFSNQRFGGGRVGNGGGNVLNQLLSPQGVLTIGGAALGASVAGPLGAPAGAALGAAVGQIVGGGLR